MTQSSILNEVASAFSLAAITAGAVAAALPIMAVGFMMAIISLGIISNDGTSAVKVNTHQNVKAHAIAQLKLQVDKGHAVKLKQGKEDYLMDAVLRADQHHAAPSAMHRRSSPKSVFISNVTHVFA